MPLDTDRVSVGHVHPFEVNSLFYTSMVSLLLYDLAHRRRLAHSAGVLNEASGVNVSTGRNQVVRRFLEGDAEWLFMVDSDMVFDPLVVERLLVAAYDLGEGAGLVGGLCFGARDGALFPTMFKFDADEVWQFVEYPRGERVEVDATGAACLLIPRGVLVRVGDEQVGLGNTAFPWFQEGSLGGRPVGEDLEFCRRVRGLGFGVWVDTSVRVGHAKGTVLTEELFDSGGAA